MLHSIWMNILYEPLYNGLVYLAGHMPGHDLGLAVIALTLVVKIITFPLTQKSLRSQIKMKSLEPKLEAIKKEFPDKQEQAKKTFELYKQEKVNPFSGCLVLLIQIPILFALYKVFWNDITTTTNLLYPFIHYPKDLGVEFLGLIDITKKSMVLAILAGVAQFIQIKLSMPATSGPVDPNDKSFRTQLMKSMNIQMRYIMPVIIVFAAYTTSGAIALYLLVNSLISIMQEIIIRKKIKKETSTAL